MDVYYYKSNQPNLGDDLNAWIWQRLIPERLAMSDDTVMLGIGTIIGQRLPAATRRIIFTSGLGYNPNTPDVHEAGWQVLAVRGPLTASILGLSPEVAVTDGAILISLFPELVTSPEDRYGTVFVPHISAARAVDWRPICTAAGIEYLDPRGDHFSVLKRIGSARLVLADAMHAAIIADSLRVPWIPLSSSAEINTFKWLDWTLSMGVPYLPVELPKLSILQWLHSLVIAATVQRHRMRTSDASEILESHRAFLRHKRRWESMPTRYLGWGLLKIYNRLLRGNRLAAARFNKREIVDRLQLLATQQGYLSEDKIFELRRRELLRRLETLK
jgi:succinoglycan biosynthesis protein ExoV